MIGNKAIEKLLNFSPNFKFPSESTILLIGLGGGAILSFLIFLLSLWFKTKEEEVEVREAKESEILKENEKETSRESEILKENEKETSRESEILKENENEKEILKEKKKIKLLALKGLVQNLSIQYCNLEEKYDSLHNRLIINETEQKVLKEKVEEFERLCQDD